MITGIAISIILVMVVYILTNIAFYTTLSVPEVSRDILRLYFTFRKYFILKFFQVLGSEAVAVVSKESNKWRGNMVL